MSQIAKQISSSSGLFSALDAITNRRAFLTLLGTSVLAASILALSLSLSLRLSLTDHGLVAIGLGFLGGLGSMIIGLSGLSAAGIHLSRHLRNLEALPPTTAFFAAIATLPRFLGIFLLLGLLQLATGLALLLLYFLCKIPGLGSLLYFVTLPLSALIIGALAYAAIFLTPLAGPAVWAGQGVFQTIATLWGILRERLLAVIIKVLILNLMTSLVSGLLVGGVVFGLMMSGGLSMMVLNDIGSNPLAAVSSIFTGGTGNSRMLAGACGAFLLLASVAVLPLLVWIAGNCIIFAEVSTGLETAALEDKMRQQLQAVREQAGEAGKRLGEVGEVIADKARHAASGSHATPVAASTCPACHTPCASADAFCGNCGHHLH